MSDSPRVTGLGLPPVVALAMLVVASTTTAQKQPDLRLDTDVPGIASSTNPQVSAAGDLVHVVWEDRRDGLADIYYSGSVNRGNGWLASAMRLDRGAPGAAQSLDPQVCSTGSFVYVVWEDRRHGQGDIYFNRSADGGSTWLAADVRLDRDPAGAAASLRPRIAFAGTGVYVVWEDRRNGESDIYFNRSTDAGSTWLATDVRLDRDPAGAAASTTPQISVTGVNLYVVWADARNGLSDIYINRSHDSGRTWLPVNLRLDTDAPGATRSTDPQICSSSGGRVFVVWSDGRGSNDIYFNRSTKGGDSWLSTDVPLDTGSSAAAVSAAPRICCHERHVYVVWEDVVGGGRAIRFNRSSNAGASWKAPQRLDVDPTGTISSFEPRVTCAVDDVHVAWRSTGGGADGIHFTRSASRGAIWLTAPVRLDHGPLGAASPELTLEGGNVYVVWEDARDGLTDVYFNVPFTIQHYGSGTPGAPVLTVGGRPLLGGRLEFRLTNVNSDELIGALLIGSGPASKTATPLFGGTLLVLPSTTVPMLPSLTGYQSFVLPLVNDPALGGLNFNFQAVFVDATMPTGVSMSGGAEVWIG